MKILRVKSLNINSLKGEFEIDFEEFLKDESLFAITGPTGAGKSTILDIITCALYGRTPRLSNPNELMSRHTGESFCEVEFEIKGKRYTSSWTLKRARKKADGNFQTAKMEIVDLHTNKILESKLREVPKFVEELTGLDFDRFKQSMMLAQGSFDAFLKAKENERSTLLEKITGTYIYKQISQEVYETYSLKKKDIENEQIALGSIELLESEVVEQKKKELEALILEKKQKDSSEESLKKISSWLENVKKLEADEIRYKKEFENISKEKEEKSEDFKKLELANKALNVQPIYQEKTLLEKTAKEEKEKLHKLSIENQNTKKLLEEKSKEYVNLKQTHEKEKITFEQNIAKVKVLRELQTKQDEKKLQEEELKQKYSSYLNLLAKLLDTNSQNIDEEIINTNISKQKEEILELKNTLEKLQEEFLQIEEKSKNLSIDEQNTRDELKKTEELISSSKEYEKVLSDNKAITKDIEEKNQEIKNLEKIKQEKSKLLEQIEQTLKAKKDLREKELLIKNYENDRAKLKEGEECFLCGSTSHPYITHSLEIDIDKTSKEILEDEQNLQKEKDEQKNIEINLARQSSLKDTQEKELKLLETKKQDLERVFQKAKLVFDTNTKDSLEVKRSELEAKLKSLVALRDTKEKLSSEKSKLENIYNQKLQEELKVQNTLSSIENVKKQIKVIVSQINSLKLERKNILDIQDIQSYETSIVNSFKELESKYTKAEKELALLKSLDEQHTKQIKELSQRQEDFSKKLVELNDAFIKALRENDFSLKEEFEKALLNSIEKTNLEKLCKEIEEKYTQSKTLKIDTTKKLLEQKKLNLSNKKLDEVNSELKELQVKIDELQKSIGSLEKELEINATNIKKSEHKIKELEKKKEAFKVRVKLNEMIGSSQGDKFSKFAQGITLDQLIFLANKHLEILSSRYELKRSSDTSKLLEIEVCDGFQGDVVRPVSTLSGGESFIVSLSLALGLSALASQKISIDSLFLDEGFGTLDADSLELALNALNQLQSSGKMVGVISHVEALKERIPLQINVMPKGDGTSGLDLS